jgi:hypothetical protein
MPPVIKVNFKGLNVIISRETELSIVTVRNSDFAKLLITSGFMKEKCTRFSFTGFCSLNCYIESYWHSDLPKLCVDTNIFNNS